MQSKLKEMQDKVDKLHEEQGLTDEVLDLQLEINALRCEHNIPDDDDEKIYEDWVQ